MTNFYLNIYDIVTKKDGLFDVHKSTQLDSRHKGYRRPSLLSQISEFKDNELQSLGFTNGFRSK